MLIGDDCVANKLLFVLKAGKPRGPAKGTPEAHERSVKAAATRRARGYGKKTPKVDRRPKRERMSHEDMRKDLLKARWDEPEPWDESEQMSGWESFDPDPYNARYEANFGGYQLVAHHAFDEQQTKGKHNVSVWHGDDNIINQNFDTSVEAVDLLKALGVYTARNLPLTY
jgi:hypothetical protein